MQPVSIYIHIPFCTHRCAYCDFNTYAGLEKLIPAYITALCREIKLVGESARTKHTQRLPVKTIFFGGGTPSLLPVSGIESILSQLHSAFEISQNAEISLEANPGTLSMDYLHNIHELGINRLSLGMQSANPGDLKILERIHNIEDVSSAIKWAHHVGLSNVNLDLIFGLPHQRLESWRDTLATALSLRPTHLALYALTIEHGTPMEKWVNQGILPEPDPDLAADMYEYASEVLDKYSYTQYEISNWASSPDMKCKHNLQYWHLDPWIGLGAGAHGYIDGFRTVAALSPKTYIQRLKPNSGSPKFPRSPASIEVNEISSDEQESDYLMMGLRLVQEGISSQDFYQRFGMKLSEKYNQQIQRLSQLGLLEWTSNQHLRLTHKGRLLGNRVFREFI